MVHVNDRRRWSYDSLQEYDDALKARGRLDLFTYLCVVVCLAFGWWVWWPSLLMQEGEEQQGSISIRDANKTLEGLACSPGDFELSDITGAIYLCHNGKLRNTGVPWTTEEAQVENSSVEPSTYTSVMNFGCHSGGDCEAVVAYHEPITCQPGWYGSEKPTVDDYLNIGTAYTDCNAQVYVFRNGRYEAYSGKPAQVPHQFLLKTDGGRMTIARKALGVSCGGSLATMVFNRMAQTFECLPN